MIFILIFSFFLSLILTLKSIFAANKIIFMRKQNQITLLILFLSLSITGCVKNNLKDAGPADLHTPGAASAGDGQNDVSGYGYDVTGEYGNSSASKFAILDVNRLKNDQPGRVEWDLSGKKYGEIVAGEDAVAYLTSLTKKLGANLTIKDNSNTEVPMFKGSISSNFDNSASFSSKYVYSSYALKIQRKRIKINADNALLMQYLTPSFINDVAVSSPQAIVNSYGTHILKDIILGAKLDISYRAETSKSDRKEAATKGIDFNLFGIFGINTNNSTSSQDIKENSNQKIVYKTIGGDPSKSLFGNVTLGANLPLVITADWENSSTLSNAEMIDIAEGGLIPVWELISDPVKSAAVKAYAIQYIRERKPELIDADPIWYPGSTPMLTYDQSVLSANKRFRLHLQQDGNLVLSNAVSGTPLWATDKAGGRYVVFQGDGNLLVYSDNYSRMLWASNKYFKNHDYSGSKDLYFIFQSDGNLVLERKVNGRAEVVAATGTGGGIRSAHYGSLR